MLFAMLSAFCIQIGTNLINDAFDVQRGADTKSRLGPKRGVQNGALSVNQVYRAGLFCFALALLFGIPLVVEGGLIILLLLVISVICGYIYTGGPVPLAYHGLGELFVTLFFGLAATLAAYFFQTGEVNVHAVLLGLQLGLLATLPIAINNLRDIVDDAKVNKRTLAVRFGETCARIEITALALTPFLIGQQWLPLLALPIAYKIIHGVWTVEPSKAYNRFLGMSMVLYLAFCVLWSLTFLLRLS